MSIKQEIDSFCPANQQEWRTWLSENHSSMQSIWVIYYKKQTGRSTISWSGAVDEALCFGWIDSTRKTLDHEKFMQLFCKRKPNSVWSKINKGKVLSLIEQGLMTEAGLTSIATAKENGSWTILDDVEELIIPEDLAEEFKNQADSITFFLDQSKSVRKAILQWLVLAKQPATRQRRIAEIVSLAAQKLRPKQFR